MRDQYYKPRSMYSKPNQAKNPQIKAHSESWKKKY